MRNGNRPDAARGADIGEGGFIEQADAIPQKIALLCLNQKSSLSYAEAGVDSERGQIRLLLPDHDVMAGTQLFQRGPLLPVQPDVLPFVLADRATLRKCRRLSKLRAARDADRFHRFELSATSSWDSRLFVGPVTNFEKELPPIIFNIFGHSNPIPPHALCETSGMSTPAQIAANQANAQFSTGPKSEAGRAAAARNNFRHGLTPRSEF